MPSFYPLLVAVARAVVKNVGNLVSFGIGGDIVIDTWEYWEKNTKEDQRSAEFQSLVQASAAEIRAEVLRLVQAEGPALVERERQQAASYVVQVPAMIRRTLRRPTDPTGSTIPSGLALRKANDLLPFLPARMPRFSPGDRPAGIGDWELVELLGVGGFGEVWKARNPHFDGVPPAALKFCLDASARDRLLKHEAAILNRVMRQGKHEGIVTLQHTYLSTDPACLQYEYINGGDLVGLIQELHRSQGGVSPHQAARIAYRLSEIVGFMHRLEQPIVHRDLKPANILVQQNRDQTFSFKITDFGIGGLAVQQAINVSRRATGANEFLATAVRGAYTQLYASPQQMRGEAPDPRDDVYSLGVIWYQLLTGDVSRGCPTGRAWQRRLQEQGMPPGQLDLLMDCFGDEPADRPASGAVLAERLAELLADTSAAARPAVTPPSVAQFVSPYPVAVPIPPRQAISPPIPSRGRGTAGSGKEAAAVEVLLGSKAGPAGQAFLEAFIGQGVGRSNLLAMLAPNFLCKPATLMIPTVPLGNARDIVRVYGPVQHGVARAVTDSVQMGILPKTLAEDCVCVCTVTVDAQALDDTKIKNHHYEATCLAITEAMRHPPRLEPCGPLVLQVGEALIGEGNELAHIDLVLGSKAGPVGSAFAKAVSSQDSRHPRLVAELVPGRPCKPDTVLLTKVTLKSPRQNAQIQGPACRAVAQAVSDCVARGVIPPGRVDELAILCAVFVHWDAARDDRIYQFNYDSTKFAIERAMRSEPKIEEILAKKDLVKHPFSP